MAFKHFAMIRKATLITPEWLALKLFPKGRAFADLRNVRNNDFTESHFTYNAQMFAEQIDRINAKLEKPNEYPYPIIYRSLMDPANYNGRPLPSRASLIEEAIALLIAGTDTTGTTMTIGTYQLLRNPETCQRLKAELKEAWPNLEDRPRTEVLEKLPYLVSVFTD